MSIKKQCIAAVNKEFNASLTASNTSYASVNKSKNVWWSNIAVSKFKKPVHIILKTETGLFWIALPVGFVSSIEKTFKIRKDTGRVDLEINAGSRNFLCDVKSGGTLFDFKEFCTGDIGML